jgi:hypothetical protein
MAAPRACTGEGVIVVGNGTCRWLGNTDEQAPTTALLRRNPEDILRAESRASYFSSSRYLLLTAGRLAHHQHAHLLAYACRVPAWSQRKAGALGLRRQPPQPTPMLHAQTRAKLLGKA